MAIGITREDGFLDQRLLPMTRGHVWFMGGFKMEQGPGTGIYAPKIGLLFIWEKRCGKEGSGRGLHYPQGQHC
jgi:hypothetical protein